VTAAGVAGRRRVLVADDSPSARRLLVEILDRDPQLQVAGEAADGGEAVRLTERVQPEVIVMDVLMPVLDGLAATRRIMELRPTPIVLVSAGVDSRQADRSFEAIRAGALTLLAKPRGPGYPGFPEEAAELRTTVRLMADVKVVRQRRRDPAWPGRAPVGPGGQTGGRASERPGGRVRIAAIGASTGGPAALATILAALPGIAPVPILVVQHITVGFHQALADWLDALTPMTVRLAAHGLPLRPGEVLIAPPGRHLGVSSSRRVTLSAAAPVGAHRPSATHLFRSVAEAYGAAAVGVILTGMGDDGAAGLCALRGAGGLVLAQDEASSVVFGMPREACATGAVDRVVPLAEMADALASAWAPGGRR
jgi:two-component system chemotaxis response regulator CheB